MRFGPPGEEKPAVELPNGFRKDCSQFFVDWNRAFFLAGGIERLSQLLAREGESLPDVAADSRWGAPIARPGKVLCIGLNYRDHAEEAGMPIPAEPILFMKGSNTVVGPFDDILIPRNSRKTDWEVELGVVLGKDARYLESPVQAAEFIAGYCISHDVSEREFQLERGGQWTKGKSCDTFNPLGPYLVTHDELPSADALAMTLKVNDKVMQQGNTATMIFDPLNIIYYLSQFMTLEAGDLITTGTPPGVGLGMKPPRYLTAGDQVELRIDYLGVQKQTCRQA
jgi:2,4-diketo-3-deoxy-L-fuconate hydrolase